MWIVSNLPRVAIRVREITGVSTPEDFLGFLYDRRAIVLQPGKNQIDFLFTPGVMGESEALVGGVAVIISRGIHVLRQVIMRVEGEHDPAEIEKSDFRRAWGGLLADHFLVERHGAFQVRDPQCDHT